MTKTEYMKQTSQFPKTGIYKMWAEPFHCDFNHELQYGRMGNCMLNAADFHSTERGFGMSYLNTVNKTWVLSRLCIEMTKLPKQYSSFNIHTWVESAMKYFTNRNFLVEDFETSEPLGYGRSVWALIDLTTRQPLDLLAVRDGEILDYIETETACPISKPGRVKLSPDAPVVMTVPVRYSDIDVNGHVNSIKYIEHTLDIFPADYFANHLLRRLDMAYVAESRYGDTLCFQLEKQGETKFVRITRQDADNGTVEVARCSLVFAERD